MTHELTLTVEGNEELGISLELPYLSESPADVIISNNGHHHLLAYKIRWEGIKHSDEIVERASIRCDSNAIQEKNLEKRKELVARNPLLPPNTRWFAGLGRGYWQIKGEVPTFEEVGRDPSLFPDIKEYKQINVTLDGAILEGGQVVGRDPVAFEKEINDIIWDNLNFLKKLGL